MKTKYLYFLGTAALFAAAAFGTAGALATTDHRSPNSRSEGLVSSGDVRTGLEEALRCMRDAGIEVLESSFNVRRDGHLEVEYAIADEFTARGEESPNEAECINTFFTPRLDRFSQQNPVTEDVRQATIDFVSRCVVAATGREAGEDLESFLEEARVNNEDVYARCLSEFHRAGR